jgi:hypothetical protein
MTLHMWLYNPPEYFMSMSCKSYMCLGMAVNMNVEEPMTDTWLNVDTKYVEENRYVHRDTPVRCPTTRTPRNPSNPKKKNPTHMSLLATWWLLFTLR